MSDDVARSYDAMAAKYAELFLGDLDGDTGGREWLAAFAELVQDRRRPVADLGCGPGHVVDHLHGLGLSAIGYDLSPGQIAEARQAFPARRFAVGDLSALGVDGCSFGGIVSRYSIIHMPAPRLRTAFEEWMRVLRPGAPVLVSFFGSLTAEAHGSPFDHKVVTAFELFPATVARLLEDVGFTDAQIGTVPIPPGGRPFDQATILARKPGG